MGFQSRRPPEGICILNHTQSYNKNRAGRRKNRGMKKTQTRDLQCDTFRHAGQFGTQCWYTNVCKHKTNKMSSHGVPGCEICWALVTWSVIFSAPASTRASAWHLLLVPTPHNLSTLQCGILDLRVWPAFPRPRFPCSGARFRVRAMGAPGLRQERSPHASVRRSEVNQIITRN